MSLPDRGHFTAPLADITARLTQLLRPMVISSGAGTTHERLGPIEEVGREGDWITLSGIAQASRFEAARVAQVVFDRTGGMKDKVIPRLEFRDAGGEVIFQISSLSGLEDFDQAFADLPHETLAKPEAEPPSPPAAEVVLEEDISWPIFQKPFEAGQKVEIAVSRPGFAQVWQGVIPAIRPAMGFINVMQGDFHLHLRGGSVAQWQESLEGLHALDAAGQPTGLRVTELMS